VECLTQPRQNDDSLTSQNENDEGFGKERRRAAALFPEKLWGTGMGSPAISFEKYPSVLQHQRALEWLVMRAQFGLALNTIDAYARALSSYFAFSEKESITPELSGRADVARWINEERERGMANATLILRLTALRLFFDYLVEENERPNNPVFRGGATRAYGSAVFRSPGPIRRLRKLPWIPTDEEWQRILEVTAEDSLRDRTMLALAYDGALRREELCSAEVLDLDFSRRLLTIRAETTKTKCGRVVPYSPATSALLCQYLNRRRSMRVEPDALFLSESSRNWAVPITPYTWTKVVEGIADRSKLPNLTTHTIRHLRLTDLARVGLDIHEIATIAGHRVLQSTHIYIHLSARDLMQAVEKTMTTLRRHWSDPA
jgi:site-specific recombinase XerD